MTSKQPSAAEAKKSVQKFQQIHAAIESEVCKAMVGQKPVIEGVLTAMLAGGHVLLEGVPGLGKTLLVRSLGEALHLDFSRIQFTPDMMPADIIGTQVLVEDEAGHHSVRFRQGPLVSNLILADEINRATPKTQSALLEAMQERQISVGTEQIQLAEPYCVMATQNPVEQEGTYPLPEAQLDRFLFKLVVGYPEEQEYHEILNRTVGAEAIAVEPASNGPEIMAMRQVVRAVAVPQHVQAFAIRLVMGTQPGSAYAPGIVNANVALGSSPRGAQGLILAGKVKALLAGRYSVASEDVRGSALDVLRHRVMVNFQGQADGITPDDIVTAVVASVKPPVEAEAAG